ncbi:MAG: HAD-IC family P-type ATPase, partial [Parachlamydia sp.]|nr:HAD-IC family P-type ATPase [Parachlamydia sp.]
MTQKETKKSFCHESAIDICSRLGVEPAYGLSDREAKRWLRRNKVNALKHKKTYSSLKLWLTQFNSPLIYMLLFAAGLSLVLYDRTDALIIFGIILVSSLLSFYQERGAAKAMEKLLKIVQIKVDVIRDGTQKSIPNIEVIPGDILKLSAGDVIPGDCALLEARDLHVDEATLTGETFYAEKQPGILPTDTPLAKQTNCLFMGTHVVSGTGKAVVVMIGKDTQFGMICEKISRKPPETEFEHGIRHFGYLLMEVTALLLIVIFACNVYLHRPVVESLLFALSLSVGLTPQLLPAIISINLALGAKRMAQKKVIVKKLASIENFGSMDVLCSDKTGTLTTGEIKLDKACDLLGNPSSK